MKTDTVGSGWRSKFIVLMRHGLFYVFDQEDSPKPKLVLELNACSVYFLHDSYFDHPFCIQIVMDSTKLSNYNPDTFIETQQKESFIFAAESEQDREIWTQFLRYFIKCCKRCEIMYGSIKNAPADVAMHGFNTINEQYREIRSIQVSICEAKAIPSLPNIKTLNPYAVILFDDVKCARTGIKTGDCPLWGEEFQFEYVMKCLYTR